MSQPLLSASQIVDAVDLQHETVTVPEWGGDVCLHQLDAGEVSAFTTEMGTIDGTKDGMYLILVHCLRDADGQRIFTMDDIPKLRKKSIHVLNTLQRIALRLNKMGVEGEAELKKD